MSTTPQTIKDLDTDHVFWYDTLDFTSELVNIVDLLSVGAFSPRQAFRRERVTEPSLNGTLKWLHKNRNWVNLPYSCIYLCMSDGQTPTHRITGTVRLSASNDSAYIDTIKQKAKCRMRITIAVSQVPVAPAFVYYLSAYLWSESIHAHNFNS